VTGPIFVGYLLNTPQLLSVHAAEDVEIHAFAWTEAGGMVAIDILAGTHTEARERGAL
jgi:hypothetical protein